MPLEMLNILMIITFTAICLFIGRILTRQPVRRVRYRAKAESRWQNRCCHLSECSWHWQVQSANAGLARFCNPHRLGRNTGRLRLPVLRLPASTPTERLAQLITALEGGGLR
jgi:hypothetical protein